MSTVTRNPDIQQIWATSTFRWPKPTSREWKKQHPGPYKQCWPGSKKKGGHDCWRLHIEKHSKLSSQFGPPYYNSVLPSRSLCQAHHWECLQTWLKLWDLVGCGHQKHTNLLPTLQATVLILHGCISVTPRKLVTYYKQTICSMLIHILYAHTLCSRC